tara:strand:- start:245 stop:2464 length:2220 start_codon:yes stop_codon:yes gene_type:complete
MRVEVQPLAGFDRLLTYEVSEKISSQIKVGCLVQIPLGRRRVLGVVFSLDSKETIDPAKLRFLVGLIQPEPVLSMDLIRLSKWICNYYSCSMESVLAAMMPAVVREGKKARNEKWIQLHPQHTKGDDLKGAPKQHELFCKLKEIGKPILKTQLINELGFGLSTIKGLITKGLVYEVSEIVQREAYDDELDDDVVESEWELTPEQKGASSEIQDLLRKKKFGVQLLHGVTGSGKTEVYFEAMEVALDQGGGVLFLVPEVSLAPQTVARLRARFSKRNEKVEVWHSHLSGGERLDAWRNLTTGRSRIVVGARSAVFAPIPSLRLVVVDEEHELAYKQEDTPRYHGRDLAVYRAMLNEACCILGSATPSLETFRNVERKKYGLSQLSKRIDGRQLPLMHIVDMRLDARWGKGVSVLSQTLVEAMRERYEKKEQTILFLNRRGFNTTMLCTDCGFVEECKDCSIALTFHRTDGYLRCHLCGFRKVAPRVCGSCKSIEIRKKGHGTQRIEDLVSELMPRSSRVVRVDADMMTKKNLFRETLRDFRLGKIDVLVGTQMIAKGLDFPNVTLVGVIDADLPLRMEDFRASERAFQLLVQVAGRAGRGDRAGEVYVQTYAPHSSSIQFSRKPDIYGFLEEEMEMRKELEYPPFRHLIRHIFRGRSLEKTEFYSNQWRKKLEAEPVSGVEVKGPALAPIEKIKGYYRFHLFYLTASVSSCLKQLKKRREDFPLDPEIHDILDVDAHQMS